jgi:copper chaperone CopZ
VNLAHIFQEPVMQLNFDVENVHCDGCARRIDRALRELPHVTAVAVDPATGHVVVDTTADIRTDAAATLARIGYPARQPAAA